MTIKAKTAVTVESERKITGRPADQRYLRGISRFVTYESWDQFFDASGFRDYLVEVVTTLLLKHSRHDSMVEWIHSTIEALTVVTTL